MEAQFLSAQFLAALQERVRQRNDARHKENPEQRFPKGNFFVFTSLDHYTVFVRFSCRFLWLIFNIFRRS